MTSISLRCIFALALVASCKPTEAGPQSPQPGDAKAETPAQAGALLEKIAPRVCSGRQRIASLVARGPLPPTRSAARHQIARGASGSKSPAVRDIYPKLAPATVVVTTSAGMGTGVIVDPAGLVLTNYHVVDGGNQDDFTIKVDVELGKLSRTGRMEFASPRVQLEGIVVKADPIRDIALIRLEGAPANLPSVALASADPKVGDAVMTVGHAGIGMLWAAKSCQVGAVGQFGHDIAEAVLLDCDRLAKHALPAGSDIANAKQSCEREREALLADAQSLNAGLMIQTDCAINHGDSGGPLVDMKGALVGLNQSGRQDASYVAFHVHAGELREFLRDVPQHPAQITPDPWCGGGWMDAGAAGLATAMGDVDLDGKLDTLAARGGGLSQFFDIDQDTFTKEGPATGDPFDAEAVLLVTSRDDGPVEIFAWYDRSNSGRWDLMLHGKDSQTPQRAFRIEADGRLVPDDRIKAEAFVDADLFDKLAPAAKDRFARIGGTLAPDLASWGARGRAADPKIPGDPLWAAGREGEIRDLNGNGRGDTLVLESFSSAGFLLDTDEDTLGKLGPNDDVQALINERSIDAEVSVIQDPVGLWAMYDTSGDRDFDLALRGVAVGPWAITEQAWSKGKGGKFTPVEGHAGRLLVRPALPGGGDGAMIAFQLRAAFGIVAASGEGLASLPEPLDLLADGIFWDDEKLRGQIIELQGDAGEWGLLIDADRSSKVPKGMSATEAAYEGHFVADLAVVEIGGFAWAYYDTDGSGGHDVVLVADERGLAAVGYRLSGTDLTLDPSLAGKPLVSSELFEGKRRKAVEKVLAKATAVSG